MTSSFIALRYNGFALIICRWKHREWSCSRLFPILVMLAAVLVLWVLLLLSFVFFLLFFFFPWLNYWIISITWRKGAEAGSLYKICAWMRACLWLCKGIEGWRTSHPLQVSKLGNKRNANICSRVARTMNDQCWQFNEWHWEQRAKQCNQKLNGSHGSH